MVTMDHDHGNAASKNIQKCGECGQVSSPRNQSQATGADNVGYDPNRIPSSVFAPKSAEWSTASNESLFSIQMGNNSFSRDHVFMMYKSGEIPKFDDMINVLNSLPPTPEEDKMIVINTDKGSSQVKEIPVDIEKVEKVGFNQTIEPEEVRSDRTVEIEKVGFDRTVEIEKEGIELLVNNNMDKLDNHEMKLAHVEENGNRQSTSYCSQGSTNSASSFAFPVLEGEGGRDSPVKKLHVEGKQQQPKKELQQSKKELQQATPQTSETTTTTTTTSTKGGWHSWFSCFSFCRVGFC